jgi:hypothetical protein
MIWFHTVVLPIATVLAVRVGVRTKAPAWKLAALVVGAGLMLSGLWLTEWSTASLIAGGVVFLIGLPRPQIETRNAGAPVAAAGQLSRFADDTSDKNRLHVRFLPPGFFLTDVRVVLQLDGTTIYDGGFLAGIDLRVPVSPGDHRLESVIDLGLAKRRRSWDVVVRDSDCDVVLEYSRMWGNFTKNPRMTW